jgi:ferrous iron transport protein A
MSFLEEPGICSFLMSNAMPRLSDISNGTCVRIDSFDGKAGYMIKLNQFGLFPGDLARVLRRAPFGGPLLLEVRGMELALGKSIASCIRVEVVVCDLP